MTFFFLAKACQLCRFPHFLSIDLEIMLVIMVSLGCVALSHVLFLLPLSYVDWLFYSTLIAICARKANKV